MYPLLVEKLSPHLPSLLSSINTIALRSIFAALTSLIVILITGTRAITTLHHHQKGGQPIRALGPRRHILEKSGTPTMGGLILLVAFAISLFLWGDLKNGFLWAVLLPTFGFALVGFCDDNRKITRHDSQGLSKKTRLFWEFLLCFISVAWMQYLTPPALQNHLAFPLIKGFSLPLGILYPFFGIIVVAGFGNAVNFTDGLDGLASGCVAITTMALIFLSIACANIGYAQHFHIFYVPQSGELSVFCAALLGACLGFLWFNAKPAQIFMGDTGSLALGAAIGAVAVALKQEILLAFIGGIFLIEILSVIIQVAWFKKTRCRVFLMAPIHHHFEKKGMQETQIVTRFWIISAILALIGAVEILIP